VDTPDYFILYTGEDIETNLSLAEKLKADFDLILPILSEETVPENYIDDVKRTIKKKTRWKVSSDIILGMFSFAKILMYKDLDNTIWPEKEKLIENDNCRQILSLQRYMLRHLQRSQFSFPVREISPMVLHLYP